MYICVYMPVPCWWNADVESDLLEGAASATYNQEWITKDIWLYKQATVESEDWYLNSHKENNFSLKEK